MKIEFFIPGLPKPGGSKQGFVLRRGGQIVTRPGGAPVVIIKEDSDNIGWKQSCAFFGRRAMGDAEPLLGALLVRVTFVMPRIGSHFGSGRNAKVLKPSAPKFHTVTPDATKLMRSTEDALTGIVWGDDKQIAQQMVQKVYGSRTGAHVIVTPIEDLASAHEEDVAPVMPLYEGVSA